MDVNSPLITYSVDTTNYKYNIPNEEIQSSTQLGTELPEDSNALSVE